VTNNEISSRNSANSGGSYTDTCLIAYLVDEPANLRKQDDDWQKDTVLTFILLAISLHCQKLGRNNQIQRGYWSHTL